MSVNATGTTFAPVLPREDDDQFEFSSSNAHGAHGHSPASTIGFADDVDDAEVVVKTKEAEKVDAKAADPKAANAGCCATIKGWITKGWDSIVNCIKSIWAWMTSCCKSADKKDGAKPADDAAKAEATKA